ncbi:methyltransferase domain-containing protein [Colletotrichum kahawae]|uniref:Methyltransferase domain-containing protein n=1 Tax=Colletotrichum kahawae TaxID=34407 RepID=A0AAD9YT03_COLKA|nr:methyltransferase domain-containing protein [Colletotrichum kahawae]
MVVAIADWPKLIENIYAYVLIARLTTQPIFLLTIFSHLNPGGWVEFQEMDGLYYSEDNTYTEDLAVFKWNREYLTACDAMGRTARPGSQIEAWVRSTGFDNVESQKFKTPIGPWAKDPQLRDVGMICLSQLLDGLEGFTLKLFCGFLDKTQEEVLVILSQVRKELKSGTAHILVNQHVVYAQKASMKAEDSLA